MNKRFTNNRERQEGLRLALYRVGIFTAGLSIALLDVLRELFVSTEIRQDKDRRLHDSDLSGELNHCTGRLDAETDPYGWYDD